MELNPPGQYADDRNLRARQRLWACRVPLFDIAAWVLDLAGLVPGMRVLDAGCGNGIYLRALRQRQVNAVGCDLSPGMLRGAGHPAVVNADVTALRPMTAPLMWCSQHTCSTWFPTAARRLASCAGSWLPGAPAWQ